MAEAFAAVEAHLKALVAVWSLRPANCAAGAVH
jgi:hypothetical protein